MPHEYLEEFVEKRFNRGRAGDDEIIRSNIQALGLGREHIANSGLQLGDLAPAQKPEYKQLMIKGNEALVLGGHCRGPGLLRRLFLFPQPPPSFCIWSGTWWGETGSPTR